MSNILTDIWYRVDRIEAKVDHLHKMLHAVTDAIVVLSIQDGDLAKLAAAGKTLELKRQQLQESLDKFIEEQPKSPETLVE